MSRIVAKLYTNICTEKIFDLFIIAGNNKFKFQKHYFENEYNSAKSLAVRCDFKFLAKFCIPCD